jgi:hypothetical protein
MTTSPHWAPPAPSQTGDDLDVDLLADEGTATGAAAAPAPVGSSAYSWRSDEATDGTGGQHTGASEATTTHYSASAGTPGRGIIVSAALASAALAVLDLALVGRLSLFFDLSFVVVCLVAGMAIRIRDLFTAAVLPPLVFGGVIAGVALLWPDTIAPHLGLVSTILAGLAHHALALIFGYGVALLTVASRVYARRRTQQPTRPVRP